MIAGVGGHPARKLRENYPFGGLIKLSEKPCSRQINLENWSYAKYFTFTAFIRQIDNSNKYISPTKCVLNKVLIVMSY